MTARAPWYARLGRAFVDRVKTEILRWGAKGFLAGLVALALWVVVRSGFADEAENFRWWQWVFIIAGLCAASAIVYLLVVWVRPRRLLYRWRVSELSGIRRVYPVRPWNSQDTTANTRQRDAAEDALRKLAEESDKIQLLLVSGHRYIGSQQRPGVLYDAIEKRHRAGHSLTLEVLLMEPSLAARRSELTAGLSQAEYAEGVTAVVWTLSQWKNALKFDVRAWYYQDDPIWQMMMTKEELWVLCAHATPTDASTIYCLKQDAPHGLTWGLKAVWDRRKNAKTTASIDLDGVSAPHWDRLKSVPPIGGAAPTGR